MTDTTGDTEITARAKQHSDSLKALRARAENLLQMLDSQVTPTSRESLGQLYEELMVFHIELDLQQEELFESRSRIENLLSEVSETFELAPFPYLKVDILGLVHRWNLMSAELFGTPRQNLAAGKVPLLTIIHPEDHGNMRSYLNSVYQSYSVKKTVLRLRDGSRHIFLTRRATEGRPDLSLVAIVPTE